MQTNGEMTTGSKAARYVRICCADSGISIIRNDSGKVIRHGCLGKQRMTVKDKAQREAEKQNTRYVNAAMRAELLRTKIANRMAHGLNVPEKLTTRLFYLKEIMSCSENAAKMIVFVSY